MQHRGQQDGADTAAAPQPGQDVLGRLGASLGTLVTGKAPAPVERWNPPFCGDIDLEIHADGSWSYNGTPIVRPALVRLFASVLRRDPERYVLVTPVECLGIKVADAPFLAVEMAVDGERASRALAFRTNLDELVAVGPDHPLRFEIGAEGGVKPYVLVRGGLWARVTRALALDLLDLGEEREVDGQPGFGIAVGGSFFAIGVAAP